MPRLATKVNPRNVKFTEADEEATDAPEEATEAAEGTEAPAEAPVASETPRKAARRAPRSSTKTEDSLFVALDDTEEFVRVLLWGREGSAKTTNALFLANLGKTLIINAEGGVKKQTLRRRGINTDNILVYPKPGEPVTYEGLDAIHTKIKSDLAKDPKSWAGVVFDSATDIVQSMVDVVSDDRVTKSRGKGATIDLIDSFFTDRSDYGTMSKMFRNIVRKFRDLQCHVVFTALERRDVDEDTAKVSYGPAVPPAVQADILGYVDIVINTRQPDEDRDYFRGATKKAGKFRSKDRLDMLPRVMVDPTMERILGYINEDLTEETDPLQEAATADARRAEQAAKAREAKKAELAAARKAKMAGKGKKSTEAPAEAEEEEADEE